MEDVLNTLRDQWIKIGLSTGPTNIIESTKYINQIYTNAELEPPEFIFTAKSPLEGIKMAAALQKIEYSEVKSSENPQQLIENKLENEIVSDFNEIYQSICFGNHDAANLAFYDYYINNSDVKDLENVVPFIELAKVCGWWIPLEGAAILINRPQYIKFDDRGAVHCDNGPAIAYEDSEFSIYVWHGTRVPAEWIRDKSLTPEIALTQKNIEQRRAACEILGWHNIITNLDGKTIDTNPDPEIGTLLEVTLPDIGTERFLWVKCGTDRTFAIPVPPDINTALEANAWTYGVPANEYIPEVRT